MGVWAKKYLTASEGNLKSNKHLKHASGMDNYPITGYNNYVPKLVLDSVNKYKELYLNKYLPDNSTLTKGVMSATFVSFKCDYQMDEDGVIDEHVRQVHHISGIAAMTSIQRIEVDNKLSFEISDLTDLEVSGPDKRVTKIESLYTRCVASGVVSKANNKGSADLNAARAQDFLTELKKRCTIPYFNRFMMYLARSVDRELESDFTCKWSVIEDCLYRAMSEEQNVQRLALFYDEDYKQYHSLPMELLINKVEVNVDSKLGRSTVTFTDKKNRVISNYGFSIRWKYKIIFNIARHLGADFKIISDHIMKVCQKMHDEPKETVDIGDFQKALCVTFENKGVISQFKTENIPAPQKTLAVNETKVKPEKKKGVTEETDALKFKLAKEYKENKMSTPEDEAIKVEVITLALNIATDPANDKKKLVNTRRSPNS